MFLKHPLPFRVTLCIERRKFEEEVANNNLPSTTTTHYYHRFSNPCEMVHIPVWYFTAYIYEGNINTKTEGKSEGTHSSASTCPGAPGS